MRGVEASVCCMPWEANFVTGHQLMKSMVLHPQTELNKLYVLILQGVELILLGQTVRPQLCPVCFPHKQNTLPNPLLPGLQDQLDCRKLADGMKLSLQSLVECILTIISTINRP